MNAREDAWQKELRELVQRWIQKVSSVTSSLQSFIWMVDVQSRSHIAWESACSQILHPQFRVLPDPAPFLCQDASAMKTANRALDLHYKLHAASPAFFVERGSGRLHQGACPASLQQVPSCKPVKFGMPGPTL